MKQAKNLTAETVDADWVETRGIVSTVLDSPAQGFFRHITLGQAGVIVSRGPGVVAGIPLKEILALAEQINPQLAPPAVAAPATAAAVPASNPESNSTLH